MDVLQALMEFNRMGVSSNKRAIMAGVVKVNGQVVIDLDTSVQEGDKIDVGRHVSFIV